jgi:hypothetical protein
MHASPTCARSGLPPVRLTQLDSAQSPAGRPADRPETGTAHRAGGAAPHRAGGGGVPGHRRGDADRSGGYRKDGADRAAEWRPRSEGWAVGLHVGAWNPDALLTAAADGLDAAGLGPEAAA